MSEKGKYARRALGSVSKNGEDLSLALLGAGFARKYHSGKREPRCKDE